MGWSCGNCEDAPGVSDSSRTVGEIPGARDLRLVENGLDIRRSIRLARLDFLSEVSSGVLEEGEFNPREERDVGRLPLVEERRLLTDLGRVAFGELV